MAGVRKRLCCDSKRTRLLFSDTRGSQKQRAEVVTVESQLEQALLRAGLVLPSNLTRERMHWEASSRTDAGVHSVSLLISAKLELHEREWQVGDAMAASPAVIARINRHLPPTVRVFAAQRVGDAFGARRNTTHREYIYFLPEQAFGGKLVEAGVDRINNVIRTFVGTHYWRSYTRLRHIDDRPVDTRYVYDLAGVLARAAPSLGKWLPLFLPNFQRSNAQVSPALPPPPEQTGEVNAQEALFGVRTLMDTIRLRNLDRRRDDAALATPDAPALSDSELLSALSATYAQDEALLVKRCCEMLRHQRNTNLFRSVLNVKCERVRIAERDWFALHVLGESFVYHQIRHIVGALGVVIEGLLPPNLLPLTLRHLPFPFAIPLAPAGALVLRDCLSLDYLRAKGGVSRRMFADEPRREFLQSVVLPRVAAQEALWMSEWDEAIQALRSTSVRSPDAARDLLATRQRASDLNDEERDFYLSVLPSYGNGRVCRDAAFVPLLVSEWDRLVVEPGRRFAKAKRDREERE